MRYVTPITIGDFKKKYKTPNVESEVLSLFTAEDIHWLEELEQKNIIQKVNNIPAYIIFSLKHPGFVKSFLLPRIVNFLSYCIKKEKKETSLTDIKNISIIKNALTKAMIAASFKPKTILEIGTYLGVGAASFKKAIPNCKVLTMNPKETGSTNNPVAAENIGVFYKKKKLKVTQIWADSTKFNYEKLPPIDVCFIDGNHVYEYVYKDLKNALSITKKCILLDDYVPKNENTKGIAYGPWSEGVVEATNDFLKKNASEYSKAYWIKGTKYSVIIK